jgi:hypothetical protein
LGQHIANPQVAKKLSLQIATSAEGLQILKIDNSASIRIYLLLSSNDKKAKNENDKRDRRRKRSSLFGRPCSFSFTPYS